MLMMMMLMMLMLMKMMLMMMINDNESHLNHKNLDQMDDCEVHVPSTLLDWNTMANFFPWGLLLIR